MVGAYTVTTLLVFYAGAGALFAVVGALMYWGPDGTLPRPRR